jgi:transcriptional regulator with XRE-family HTH domain
MISTPKEDLISIGKKFKEIRLSQRLMRKTLALRSGMSESSLKRFEVTGEISLDSLVKISNVLNVKSWISSILAEEHFESINDIVKSKKKIKKRGVI